MSVLNILLNLFQYLSIFWVRHFGPLQGALSQALRDEAGTGSKTLASLAKFKDYILHF